MNNILKYKGYMGSVNFDAEDRIFHGRVMGIEDIIGFEGNTVDSLEKDFQNAIDDYFETCQEINKAPEKPFSGKIVLEIPPDLYHVIATEAVLQHKPIDVWIIDACRKTAGK